MNDEARAALEQVAADTTAALEYARSRRAQLARDLADIDAQVQILAVKASALNDALDTGGD